jgi:hypothetical protein
MHQQAGDQKTIVSLRQYVTLTEVKIEPGEYNQEYNPNLLPINKILAEKVTSQNNNDGSVNIDFYVD